MGGVSRTEPSSRSSHEERGLKYFMLVERAYPSSRSSHEERGLKCYLEERDASDKIVAPRMRSVD